MNTTNFVQTGGFPVKAERLQELQTAYSIFNHLGNLAGNLAILSGCNVVGTAVSDGYVFIDNEVIEFKAGTLAENVIIIETASSKEFKNGELKPVHYERYATFGNAETSYAWDDFKRPDPMITLMARLDSVEKKAAVFTAGGGMVLWNKPAAEIPEGWAEVIDWRGRMPVGYDVTQTEFNTMGKIGGAKNKTLSINEMPSHSHEFKINTNAAGDGMPAMERGNSVVNTTYTTESAGNGQSFSIMNPYRVVMFIEYIG